MKGYFGRDDISLTVHTPFPCGNRCGFCTNRELYQGFRFSHEIPDICSYKLNIMKQIEFVLKTYSDVKAVCITGGEPFKDDSAASFTMELINAIKWFEKKYHKTTNEVKIYINTTLPKDWTESNFEYFMDLYYDSISGISVSRHAPDHIKDEKCFKVPVVDDKFIAALAIKYPKRFRINCVCSDKDSAKYAVDRWIIYSEAINEGYLKLNLREDYTNINFDNLKRFTELDKEKYGFLDPVDLGGCNVCNTYATRYDFINIHKGVEHTSIFNERFMTMEINDLVISPVGELTYDWEKNDNKKGPIDFIINKSNSSKENIEVVDRMRRVAGEQVFGKKLEYKEYKSGDWNRVMVACLKVVFGSLDDIVCIIARKKDNNQLVIGFRKDSKYAMAVIKDNGEFHFKPLSNGEKIFEEKAEVLGSMEELIDMIPKIHNLSTLMHGVPEPEVKVDNGEHDHDGCSAHMVAPQCGF